jgi:hypothetical protein
MRRSIHETAALFATGGVRRGELGPQLTSRVRREDCIGLFAIAKLLANVHALLDPNRVYNVSPPGQQVRSPGSTLRKVSKAPPPSL